jgi:phage shock protein PspC (stress-responsive transcriptional regulator)
MTCIVYNVMYNDGVHTRRRMCMKVVYSRCASRALGIAQYCANMASCNVLFVVLVLVLVLVRVSFYLQAAIATPSREGPADSLQKEEGHSAEVRASE